MRWSIKSFVIALVAILAASAAGGTASANTISVEPAGAITMTSLGSLSLTGRGGIELSIECPITLRGSFSRTINNATGGSVGSLTSGSVGRCNTGTVRLLIEERSPWTLRLAEPIREEGALRLANITIGSAKVQAEGILGQTCLYEGNVASQLEAEGPRNEEVIFTRLWRLLANSERIVRNSGLCPERGELRGSFRLAQEQGLLVRGQNWTAETTVGEEGGKKTETVAITYTGMGMPAINGVTHPAEWTLLPGENCLRTFTPSAECTVVMRQDVAGTQGFLRYSQATVTRVAIRIGP